ncbi:uncharacterized protein [Watersipora subatra]|uniref:uncharacterized protein n=1 Tax=Watersipora subatra TaxID=2589382 RepID=UPI00355B0459
MMNSDVAMIPVAHKRRWVDEPVAESPVLIKAGTDFITLHREAGLLHTENWVNKDTSLFTPLIEDTSLRIRAFDQITYPCNHARQTFFVGDAGEKYTGTVAGRVIHLWKYSSSRERLCVARSILCTDDALYDELWRALTCF